jgi:hypothetical protein
VAVDTGELEASLLAELPPGQTIVAFALVR